MKNMEQVLDIISNLQIELKRIGKIEAQNERRLLAKKNKGDLVCITSAILDLRSAIDYLKWFGDIRSEVHQTLKRVDAEEREEREQKRRWLADQNRIKRKAKMMGIFKNGS